MKKYLTVVLVSLVLFYYGCSSGGSAGNIQATRSLPSGASNTFTVTINLDLEDGGTDTIGVEETLPGGCSLQGSSHTSLNPETATWFFSNNPSYPLPHNPRADTTLTYDVSCSSSGKLTFEGQVVSDTAGSVKTKGDTSITI